MIAADVRAILVPLAEYPHITQTATVREAFALLHKQHMAAGWRYRHLLVFDASEALVGVIGLSDLLRALMPEYLKASATEHFAGSPPDASSLSIIWQDCFDTQCKHVAEARVEQYMAPVPDTVQIDDPLCRAAYLMVAHHTDMLPVLDGDRVVGAVRIVDVFNQAAAAVLHD